MYLMYLIVSIRLERHVDSPGRNPDFVSISTFHVIDVARVHDLRPTPPPPQAPGVPSGLIASAVTQNSRFTDSEPFPLQTFIRTFPIH
jgi:hypothetical protein